MIHLRFLGGAALERDGALVTGRAAQRHHLALLAILAASPAQTASRDKLIGLLWPERETSRARHRLSVALHVLRRSLGEDCLVTSGDGVALNPDACWADVSTFMSAFAAGRLEAAVGHYTGPFLDGFFVNRAPELERWMDTERERMAGMYRVALERLIAEAEAREDTVAAVQWWQLLADYAPHSAPVAIGVLHALAAIGDIAGALLHARAHIALVRSEFDLSPDPEVLALASELQRAAGAQGQRLPERVTSEFVIGSRPPAEVRAWSAPARPHGIPGRLRSVGSGILLAGLAVVAVVAAWALRGEGPDVAPISQPSVVVRAFVESGSGASPTGLGEALGERIAATLSLVPGLQVRMADTTRPASRALPEHVGSPVVEGTLQREGDRWRVVARLVDQDDNGWTETWERPVGDRALLLDEVSFAIGDAVRLHALPYEPKVYTESRRAYDRFLQGVYAHRRFTDADIWTALQFYREAWEEDPAFALAYAVAGNAYIALTLLGLAPEIGFERAREHVVRALKIDSTLAEGHAALGYLQIWGDLDFDAGERSLRRAIMLYPTLPQARDWYGWYLLHVRNQPDAAVASVRQALEMDPLNTARSYGVEWVLYRARRYDEVAEQNRVTWTLGPDIAHGFLDSPLGHAYRELGRYEDAIAEFRALEERTGSVPAGLALTYARMGREADARAMLRSMEADAEGPGGSPLDVARVHANLGDMNGAFAWLDRAYELHPAALVRIRADPSLDPIRADPRYLELLERVGLPREAGSG